MKFYIGADLGTSALKLLLVDEDGKIAKSVTREYPVFFPKPGFSEQNPEDWWSAVTDGTRELVSGQNPDDIVGFCTAGQMHGLVVLDENDNVIRPAILWNDGRTHKETGYLNETIGKSKLSQLTANIAFAGFTAPKILWLKENEKENFDKISKIMLPKDYITYKLTGQHITDYSDASGMLLLDVKNKCWSKEMIEICGIEENQLPILKESYEGTKINTEIAELLGISKDCMVAAGAGDNAGGAIGTGTTGNGKCTISIGTSGTIFISSDSFSVDEHNSLHSFCHADGGYHLMGCILSAASCNKWFCEDILKTDDFAKEQEDIKDTDLGSNHVYFLPYLMGERSPLNDTDARGTFTGMRLDTTRKDMVQAVLEGVAFALRDNLEIAKKNGIDIKSATLCGGGAKSPLWQKIIANVLNIEINIPVSEEGPGYGGALLAMVAAGKFNNIQDCAEKFVNIKSKVMPDEELSAKYEKQYQKFKKIYPALKNIFKELKEE